MQIIAKLSFSKEISDQVPFLETQTYILSCIAKAAAKSAVKKSRAAPKKAAPKKVAKKAAPKKAAPKKVVKKTAPKKTAKKAKPLNAKMPLQHSSAGSCTM